MSCARFPRILAIGFGWVMASLAQADEAPDVIKSAAEQPATPVAPEKPAPANPPPRRLSVFFERTEAPPLAGEAARRVEAMTARPEDLQRDMAAEKKRLKDAYRLRLGDMLKPLKGDELARIAPALEEEKKRLEADDLKVEDGSSPIPFEVLVLRNSYLAKVAALPARLREQEVRNRAVALGELASELAGKGDYEGSAAVRGLMTRERVELEKVKQKEIARDLHRTATAGSAEGAKFEEVGPGDTLLIGFAAHTATRSGQIYLAGLQPLFRSNVRTIPGEIHGAGQEEPARLEARPGYAVGRVRVQTGEGVEGLGLTYMRVRPGGLGLDPEDAYDSEWIGVPAAKPVTLGHGVPVRGIFGTAGKAVSSLGLLERGVVFDLTSKSSRENGAQIEVANLFPYRLEAGPANVPGKWQSVSPLLRGATIYMGKPPTAYGANGVSVFRTLTAGRVFVALNYSYQGNGGGGWGEEAWSEQAFLDHGWTRVENAELVRHDEGHRVYIILTKELKQHEIGRIRCNKYEPPYLITFAQPPTPAPTSEPVSGAANR